MLLVGNWAPHHPQPNYPPTYIYLYTYMHKRIRAAGFVRQFWVFFGKPLKLSQKRTVP